MATSWISVVAQGDGLWAMAFKRDRPDLRIDLVDQNAHTIDMPAGWAGNRFSVGFTGFSPDPDTVYDGIWAKSSLFFLPLDEMGVVFDRLVGMLKPGGIFTFDLVDDCEAISMTKFTGVKMDQINAMLARNNLDIVVSRTNEVTYGAGSKYKVTLPTYYFDVQKKPSEPSQPIKQAFPLIKNDHLSSKL
jgi:hypothetical protein